MKSLHGIFLFFCLILIFFLSNGICSKNKVNNKFEIQLSEIKVTRTNKFTYSLSFHEGIIKMNRNTNERKFTGNLSTIILKSQ